MAFSWKDGVTCHLCPKGVFGEPRPTAPFAAVTSTDFTYTGQRDLPGTGLMDYNARFYSPALKRFIQPDSITPGVKSQSGNRYSYVLNNPINANDPSGRICVGEPGECLNNDGTASGGFGGGTPPPPTAPLPNPPSNPNDDLEHPHGHGGGGDGNGQSNNSPDNGNPQPQSDEPFMPPVSNYRYNWPSKIPFDFWLYKITFFYNFLITSNLPGAPMTISNSDVIIGNASFSDTSFKYILSADAFQVGPNIGIAPQVGVTTPSFSSVAIMARTDITVKGEAYNSTFRIGVEYEGRPKNQLIFAGVLVVGGIVALIPESAPFAVKLGCQVLDAC